MNLQRFHLNNLQLTVDPTCYLITVAAAPIEARQTSLSDLPDWIFTSKHAIWLVEENKPIADRARDGELIRRHLRNNLRIA